MARNSERFAASPASVFALCFAVLSVGTSIGVLQGCRQVEEGTDSTTNENEEQYAVQDQLPGCWTLRITAQGAQRDSLRSWLPAGSLPSIIELDTTLAESASSDSVYKAYSWSNGRRESQPFSVWRPSSDDSIRVQRAGAMSGRMLQISPSNGKFVGSVVEFTDRLGDSQRRSGPVEAVPTECPRR